jgi:alanyl-tRNA synthetase
MLRCFLSSDLPDVLKLQASQLLLFKVGDTPNRLAALEYVASYLENRVLNYAERGSIATVMEQLLEESNLVKEVRDRARYLLFVSDPKRMQNEQELNELFNYLLSIVEGEGGVSSTAAMRMQEALQTISDMVGVNDNLKKKAHYLLFTIKNSKK